MTQKAALLKLSAVQAVNQRQQEIDLAAETEGGYLKKSDKDFPLKK